MPNAWDNEIALLRAEIEALRADLQAVAKYLLGLDKGSEPLRRIIGNRDAS